MDIITKIIDSHDPDIDAYFASGELSFDYSDIEGNNLFHLAALKGGFFLCKYLANNDPNFEIDVKNDSGWTPLLITAREGHQDVTMLFIALGASTEAVADDGSTLDSLTLDWSTEAKDKIIRFKEARKVIELKEEDRCNDVPYELIVDQLFGEFESMNVKNLLIGALRIYGSTQEFPGGIPVYSSEVKKVFGRVLGFLDSMGDLMENIERFQNEVPQEQLQHVINLMKDIRKQNELLKVSIQKITESVNHFPKLINNLETYIGYFRKLYLLVKFSSDTSVVLAMQGVVSSIKDFSATEFSMKSISTLRINTVNLFTELILYAFRYTEHEKHQQIYLCADSLSISSRMLSVVCEEILNSPQNSKSLQKHKNKALKKLAEVLKSVSIAMRSSEWVHIEEDTSPQVLLPSIIITLDKIIDEGSEFSQFLSILSEVRPIFEALTQSYDAATIKPNVILTSILKLSDLDTDIYSFISNNIASGLINPTERINSTLYSMNQCCIQFQLIAGLSLSSFSDVPPNILGLICKCWTTQLQSLADIFRQ